MTQALYGPDLAHVHDAAFGDWAREAAPFVLARLREAEIEEGLVVDLGCGSGIWAAELLGAGYEVLGVDTSAEMLALASSRAPRARLRQSSLYDVELPPCGAITAIGECMNYNGPPSLELLFRRAHAALEPNGLLVFDAAAPGREPELHRRTRYAGDGWVMDVEVSEDRAEGILTRRIALVRDGRASEEVHLLRLHARGEVVEWLEAAGFDVTTHPSYGVARGLPSTHIYVATRRQR
jgi:SAM-dependent methyltransferase